MRAFALLSVLTAAATAWAQSGTIDAYLATESSIARSGVFANIGPSGSKSSGAKAGVVIASPSTSDPDYLYTWTRDSSLVFKELIDQYTLGRNTSAGLRTLIDSFVGSQSQLQQTSNPSGPGSTTGLGEPKFNIDLSPFTGAWGRPQRDGPALRSIAFITYANWLRANGNATFVTSRLWPIIKLDLDYVATYWNQSTFDLWEEVSSSSFYTTAVQHRSLRQGAALATALGQTSSASTYSAQAANTLCFLQSYWNPNQGYITANTGGGRSGKDANAMLASIHTFDPAAGCDAATFQPCSDKALSNLKVYVDSFRSIWSINSGKAANAAVATGRYPEDVYYSGNPWYLTTTGVSEQLYDALITWNRLGSISVTATSLPFFRSLYSSAAVGTYPASSATYTALTSAVKTFADGFVAVVQQYTPSGGNLAEQYQKSNGSPLSARDLTWSYSAFVTMAEARAGLVPAGWGAGGLTVPSQCSSSGGGGGGTIPVAFNVRATTVLGENIYVTGSVDALKNWSPNDALLLSNPNYPTWSITVNLPASTAVQYKYIRKNNGAVTWESDPNRVVNVPASGSATTNDTWR